MKRKPKPVKVWVWQNIETGKFAETTYNSRIIDNAPTRREAEERGVDTYRWRLVRVEIKVLK